MKRRAEIVEIDWTQEYAGCRGGARRAQKQKRKHRVRRFLGWVLLDILLTAVVMYLLMEFTGLSAAALAGGFADALPMASSASATPQDVRAGGPCEVGPVGLAGDAGAGTVLKMDAVLQNPALPNGCEATSLAATLAYFGYDADKNLMAYDYMPRVAFDWTDGVLNGPDPNEAYAGDPATSWGFYCFAGPVVAGANAYLAEVGSALSASDISGADMARMEAALDAGSPVILWVTLDFGEAVTYLEDYTWRLPNGTWYTPYRNLHCVVLHGYDADGTWHLCDPLTGNITMDAEQVYRSYLALGGHAAVVG